jgi:WD40 repeat protein
VLAFNRDGSRLAMASPADGLVWLWDTEKGEPELIFIDAADNCTLEGIAVSPDGRRIAVGGIDYLSTGERDGAVCIWDVATRERCRHYDVGVSALAYDPQGQYLAAAGLEGAILVWNTASDSPEPALVLRGALDGEEMFAVTFSPDGRHLLAGNGRTLRVWSFPSGEFVVGREFASPVRSVAFCREGSTLFLGHANSTCSRLAWWKLLSDD